MRRLPKNISLLAVSVVALSGLAVQPVFAEKGLDDGTPTTVTSDGSGTSASLETIDSPNSGSNTSTDSSGSVNTETRTGGGKGPSGLGIYFVGTPGSDGSHDEQDISAQAGGATEDNLRAAAAQLLRNERQNVKNATTMEQRQKACVAHQAELTKRQANYTKAATNHLDTFNSIYAKVLAFQSSKQLTASNFDTLKAQADTWKTNASDAVTLLSGTDTKIDCTSADPAASVANLKTAVAGARNALQSYREAIKNLVGALQQSFNSNKTTGTPTATPEAENAQ